MEKAILVFAVLVFLVILFILAKNVIRSRRFRFMVFKRLSLLDEPYIRSSIQKQREHVQEHVTRNENAIKYFQEEIEKEKVDIALNKGIAFVRDDIGFDKNNAIMRSKERINDLLARIEFQASVVKAQKRVLGDYDYLLDGKSKTPPAVQATE